MSPTHLSALLANLSTSVCVCVCVCVSLCVRTRVLRACRRVWVHVKGRHAIFWVNSKAVITSKFGMKTTFPMSMCGWLYITWNCLMKLIFIVEPGTPYPTHKYIFTITHYHACVRADTHTCACAHTHTHLHVSWHMLYSHVSTDNMYTSSWNQYLLLATLISSSSTC